MQPAGKEQSNTEQVQQESQAKADTTNRAEQAAEVQQPPHSKEAPASTDILNIQDNNTADTSKATNTQVDGKDTGSRQTSSLGNKTETHLEPSAEPATASDKPASAATSAISSTTRASSSAGTPRPSSLSFELMYYMIGHCKQRSRWPCV